jgi:hypothetical protein
MGETQVLITAMQPEIRPTAALATTTIFLSDSSDLI